MPSISVFATQNANFQQARRQDILAPKLLEFAQENPSVRRLDRWEGGETFPLKRAASGPNF
jgi:hypothetical protein